jgi:hypothetical protein
MRFIICRMEKSWNLSLDDIRYVVRTQLLHDIVGEQRHRRGNLTVTTHKLRITVRVVIKRTK